jgi:hypothetical protein
MVFKAKTDVFLSWAGPPGFKKQKKLYEDNEPHKKRKNKRRPLTANPLRY